MWLQKAIIQPEIKLTRANDYPVYKSFFYKGMQQINPSTTLREYNYMKINDFDFYDNLLMTDKPSLSGTFLNLDEVRRDRFEHHDGHGHVILYDQFIELSKSMITYERQCYSLLDFFGDSGGVLDLLIGITSIFT